MEREAAQPTPMLYSISHSLCDTGDHYGHWYESKNGHLKNTIHGKCHALDQLVIAVDTALTLEKNKSALTNDNENTIHFISSMKGHKPRAGMTLAGEHLYKLGHSNVMSLSDEEARVVESQQAPVLEHSMMG